jgi:hypothetical protein
MLAVGVEAFLDELLKPLHVLFGFGPVFSLGASGGLLSVEN